MSASPAEVAAAREAYLKGEDVPRFVDSFVASLLEKQPKGAEAIAAHAAEHALATISDRELRAKVAAPFVPPQTPPSQQLNGPPQQHSTPSAAAAVVTNQSFVQDASPAVRPEGQLNRPYSMIAHNASIDVLNQATLAGSHHRTSIVSYNMGQISKGQPWYRQSTKVCATIGPATRSVEAIRSLVENGAVIFRLNFSFGSREFFREVVANIREVERQVQRELTIVMDTAGPELRVGKVPNDRLELRQGMKLCLSTNEEFAENPTETMLYVDHKELPKIVGYSSRILVSEGNLELRVIELGEDFVECIVQTRHYTLLSHRNINLPGVALGMPIISERDKHQIDFAVDELGVDGIFLSFVQAPGDIDIVNEYLGDRKAGRGIFIFAKIENQEGLQNFDGILEKSDGIMVARGDLGAELPVKKLFLAQKMIISKCNVKGKPVIVAAQLLESLILNPHPTRAEANDVANAVLDGADCLQLSGETAVGEYPDLAVSTLTDIAAEANAYVCQPHFFQSMLAVQQRPLPPEESISSSAVNAAQELGAKAIVALTTKGSSATLVSKYLPPCPVIAVCKKRSTAKLLNLVRSIIPYHYEGIDNDERQERIDRTLYKMLELGMVDKGDTVVAVHADATTGYANLCRVLEV